MTTLTPDEIARAIDAALSGIEGIRPVPTTGAVVVAAGRDLVGLGGDEPAPATKVTTSGTTVTAELNIAVTGERSAARAAELAGEAASAVLKGSGAGEGAPEIVVRVVAVDAGGALTGGAHVTAPSGP